MKFLLLSFATFFLLGLVAAQIPQCDDLPVNCFADPCSVTTCKTGVCQTSTCNCDAYCMCKSDSDCAEDEFCRTLGWEEDAGAACHRFAQEGESCGGFVMPSYLETCAAGLVCDYRPFIADAPGTCRRECEISKDCENENQYCSEAGTCKDLGDCGSTADCLNNDNAFIRIECVGLTYCNWDGTCAVDCSPSCKDSSDCPPEFFCGKDNLCVMDVFCDASECEGPAPMMPNSQCSDGSVSGPVCMLNPNGACSWQIRDCPVYVPPASCVPSDCDGPAPLFASQLCPDGTIAGPICVMAGYYYNFASSADIIIDGVERQSSPDGVEEQSFPGSGPNGGSQCVWQVSFCPPPVGPSEPCDISKCPDAHTEDAMVCPDGTTFGRQCLYDDTIIVDPLPGTNPETVEGERTCSWLFPPCPTEVNECPQDQCPPVHTMMARMCDDGSVAQDLCVTAPDNSCVWTLVCPEDQHNNGQCKKGKGCDHPLAGPCLGICGVSETEEEMCFLNRYDTCTGRGVTVIAISNSAAESMERVLQDIRKVLDIKSKHLVRPLRTLANIYVVELVDEEDVKRNNGEASSERLARKLLDMTRSELLQGTTLQEADFVVLPAQSHIRDLHQDNNNDSSSSEATAVYPFMAVLALLSVVAGLF